MQKILLRSALIVFGLLLLVGVEAALRLLWSPPPLAGEELALVAIDPFRVEDGIARTDPAFKGVMQPASFAHPKPAGRYRVFCLGGSTTMGYPSPPDAAWPAVLERSLRALHPGRDLEVINVGGNSYGTGRTLAVLRGIRQYQPDLVIVATGDTEFVEDSFRAAVALPTGKITWLHRLYLSRALKKMLPEPQRKISTVDARDSEAAGFLFAPMPDNSVYQVSPERREAVMREMDNNLREIVRLARESDLPLLFCSLPSNLAEWPPDPDPMRPPDPAVRTRWEALWREGERLLEVQQPEAALERFASAAQLWDNNAGFSYAYGQLLRRLGRMDAARYWLVRARDLDPAPVRSTSAAQALVRQAATAGGGLFVDLAGHFAKLSPDGLTGGEWIFDYAHPTPRGHVLIASAIGEVLDAGLPGWSAPPATRAAVQAVEMARAATVVSETSADLSYVQGEVFARKGRFDRAAEMYRQAIALGNQGAQVRLNLAMALAQQGELSAAIDIGLQLTRSHPQWPRAFALLGSLYEQTQQPAEAVKWYQRALASGETETSLFAVTAALLLRQGDGAAARDILQKGVALYPNDCRLAALIGESLEAERDLAGAEGHYRQLLARDPVCQQAWEGLGLVLMNQERWGDAALTFETALRHPAPLPYHHLNLGIVYAQGLGKRQLAVEQFRIFLALQPEKISLVPPQFRPEMAKGGVHE